MYLVVFYETVMDVKLRQKSRGININAIEVNRERMNETHMRCEAGVLETRTILSVSSLITHVDMMR